MQFIAPPPLTKNDTIGVISPASHLDANRYYTGKEILQNRFGYNLTEGRHLFDKHFNFAGTDENRLQDFQQFLDNPSVKAIIAGRGGYGTSRIIDQINWENFRKNPKWVIGFSDITLIHQKIQSLGFQSIHGPMMVTLQNEDQSTESLIRAISGEALDYIERGHPVNRSGNATAEIVGGNLCLLAHNIGSLSDLSWNGKILFLEDIGEYYYNIDRMILQLKRAGKLKNLAGLIIGQFSDNKDNNYPFGKNANEIIAEHIEEYSFPVCFDFPIGHDKENRAIRCGETISLSVSTEKVQLQSFSNGISI
jgi:muramoyltetrapeptide carboxypeptidase